MKERRRSCPPWAPRRPLLPLRRLWVPRPPRRLPLPIRPPWARGRRRRRSSSTRSPRRVSASSAHLPHPRRPRRISPASLRTGVYAGGVGRGGVPADGRGAPWLGADAQGQLRREERVRHGPELQGPTGCLRQAKDHQAKKAWIELHRRAGMSVSFGHP